MVTWKFLFIAITTLILYFAYGVASHGGPLAFFAGVAVGSIVTYLFTRYRQEAQQNHNTNTQNVQVNLHQQKVKASGLNTLEIAELVDSMLEQKLLLAQQQQFQPIQPFHQPQQGQQLGQSDNQRRNEIIARTLKELKERNG